MILRDNLEEDVVAIGYLGEFPVDIASSKFASFSPTDWAMRYIERFGGCDGGHHKAWVLDQVARILKGTEVIVVEGRWINGEKEFRETLAEPTQEYLDWVVEMKGEYDEENDEYEYEYDEGIAP